MRIRSWRTAKTLMIVTALSGGSLFTTCVGRVRMAAIDGSTSYFFDVLNDAAVDIIDDLAATEE